jgi:undecaprenyl-diphosphatase
MNLQRVAFATMPGSRSSIRGNVLLSGLTFVLTVALAMTPDMFDRPVTSVLNEFADRFPFLDRLLVVAFSSSLVPGAILIALIWYSWFDTNDNSKRSQICVGTLASCAAGILSRFFQRELPTHPRPFYDPALGFHMPTAFELPLNTWNSFPSDHMTVFAGLVVVLCIARSRFKLAAIALTAIFELTRTYMGAHYPSDLLGGAALASTVVWASQTPWLVSWGSRIVVLEQRSPAMFYMIAFLFSFQIATLAAELRWAATVILAGTS